MSSRYSVGNTSVPGFVSGKRTQVTTGLPSGHREDIEETEPREIVVVPGIDAHGRHQTPAQTVALASAKLNCPPTMCHTLPAGGVVPCLKALPTGLAGAVGGALLGGASMGAAVVLDAALDPASKGIITCVVVACTSTVGFLAEHACRSDN